MSDCMAGRSSHRQGADRVGDQTQDVRPFAPEEIADLAADEDERGRDQRLERDRGLDRADGRAEVGDHRRDRDIHERRVDHEDEHRHRQQDGQASVCGRRLRRGRWGCHVRGTLKVPVGP
jgi:hypothetical protein